MNIFNQGLPHQDSLIRAHICENHFGFSPLVQKNLEHARMHLYPDPDCYIIRRAIADFHGIDPEMVTVSNGTDEIILMIAMAFFNHDIHGLVAASSFPGYITSAEACGAQVKKVDLNGYFVPFEAMSSLCLEQQFTVFLCNPHNPTGTIAHDGAIERLVHHARVSGSLVVVDEAYAEFAGKDFVSAIDLIKKNNRLLVTRTFSKAYGLAGFRIGYAIGMPEDIEKIRIKQRCLPFCVNRLAQNAALCALADQDFITQVTQHNNQIKNRFYKVLDSMGINYVNSHTNFVLMQIKNSADFAARLYKNFGILVRDTGPFGLPDHLRVSMLGGDELETLSSAISDVFNNRDIIYDS